MTYSDVRCLHSYRKHGQCHISPEHGEYMESYLELLLRGRAPKRVNSRLLSGDLTLLGKEE